MKHARACTPKPTCALLSWGLPYACRISSAVRTLGVPLGPTRPLTVAPGGAAAAAGDSAPLLAPLPALPEPGLLPASPLPDAVRGDGLPANSSERVILSVGSLARTFRPVCCCVACSDVTFLLLNPLLPPPPLPTRAMLPLSALTAAPSEPLLPMEAAGGPARPEPAWPAGAALLLLLLLATLAAKRAARAGCGYCGSGACCCWPVLGANRSGTSSRTCGRQDADGQASPCTVVHPWRRCMDARHMPHAPCAMQGRCTVNGWGLHQWPHQKTLCVPRT